MVSKRYLSLKPLPTGCGAELYGKQHGILYHTGIYNTLLQGMLMMPQKNCPLKDTDHLYHE